MSFSKEIKEELLRHSSKARHCRLAEIASLLSICGKFVKKENGIVELILHTENLTVARKYFTLVQKTFNINTKIIIRKNMPVKKSTVYILTVMNKDALTIAKAIKLISHDEDKDKQKDKDKGLCCDGILVQNTCCKRSFIRGTYLAAGSMSDPEKAYHMEFVMPDIDRANQLQEMINSFLIDAKIIIRKKYYVVYLKEGSQVADLLNVMEAPLSMMNFENVRILKEMRNSINRQVNCEAANINKTVVAASKQIDDILYIRETIGFNGLSEGLEEIAGLRIDYPEASLKELGEMLNPPIGKSGVNHRLKKLSIIADKLRE